MEHVEAWQQSVQTLTTVVWVLLIPIGVLLIAVLIKVLFLLNDVGQFVSLAQYEAYPLLKDVRHIVSRADKMTEKATGYVDKMESKVEEMGDSMNVFKRSSSTLWGGISTGLGLALGSWAKGLRRK